MENRKTAPALRARPLRSYVPLRCVRTKVRPPALPHPFPTEISPPTNSIFIMLLEDGAGHFYGCVYLFLFFSAFPFFHYFKNKVNLIW